MSTIHPARLRPGVSLEDVDKLVPEEGQAATAAVRGKTLIFWDRHDPTRKMDAIDTDQITPSEDCVSESLDTLDERWKEGAFRHLMPGFRDRVKAGHTFVIAGDRFGIGSSREMSPAGLKAIAEEAGHTMVIVCGNTMGDIFRRNALNLGLHVVQSPEAVAEARENDEMEFDPATRSLRNVTRDKSYAPLELTEVEEEIRSTGGIFALGRREVARSVRREVDLRWPTPDEARTLSTTEQIVWAHRVDRTAAVQPGATLQLFADLLPASDGTAPFAIYTFERITGGNLIDPRQAAIASDHFVFTGRRSDDNQTAISEQFARRYGLDRPYYARPGDGIFHFYFPEQGLVVPGAFIPGADSHSRAYGAYGAMGIGVGSTTLGFGWATGTAFCTLAKQRRVVFKGQLQPWVGGKDIVLALLRRWGKSLAQGMSVEFVDAERQLPMTFRNTIANMMAEAEALNGIFAQDAITTAWFEERGFKMPYPVLQPGAEARWAIDEELDLSEIRPMIARPYAPGNAHAADEMATERVTFDKAMIGSCTNGSYDDLLSAALVLRQAAGRGMTKATSEFIVFPGSGQVKERIEEPDPRLDGNSVADVLRGAGAVIRQSWCGPCFGQGPDALTKGQRAITTFNRNWTNRMGVGGEGFLASPAVVAASALVGYMAPPSELGLEWKPELYQ